jgi:hypothetical protein
MVKISCSEFRHIAAASSRLACIIEADSPVGASLDRDGVVASESHPEADRRPTRAKFGHMINPHLFRDSAATSIAIEDPKRAYITRSIPGHGTLRTSEQYYNHAQSREALRQYQRRILELRRRHTSLDSRGLRAVAKRARERRAHW